VFEGDDAVLIDEFEAPLEHPRGVVGSGDDLLERLPGGRVLTPDAVALLRGAGVEVGAAQTREDGVDGVSGARDALLDRRLARGGPVGEHQRERAGGPGHRLSAVADPLLVGRLGRRVTHHHR